MNSVKILVAENPNSVEVDLANRLTALGFTVLRLVATPFEALDYVRQHTVDLVLMDDFSDLDRDGYSIAKEIKEQFQVPVLMLISNSGFKASQPLSIPLLFKPAHDQELFHHVHLELQHKQQSMQNGELQDERVKSPDELFVRSDYRLNKVRIADIYYVEAMKDYVLLHTEDNVFKVHTTVKKLLAHLRLPHFIRIHRSYIVNCSKISSVKYPELIVERKMKSLPIGGLYRKDLFEQLNIL